MKHGATKGRMTEEEFLALPETNQRVEFIDGKVYASLAPTVSHQHVVLQLAKVVERWALRHPPAAMAIAPLDVRVVPGRIIQPDVLLCLDGIPRTAARIEGTPDLVAEVLSSNEKMDRVTKRKIYFEAGGSEYWVVDIKRGVIEVAWNNAVSEVFHSVAVSRVAKGLKVDVKKLFR
jgi:Uma2 family endonuclease